MYSIERIEELIKNSEGTLAKYELLLKTSPNNLFYKGIVKNTLELLVELRATISDAEARRLIFEQFKNK